MSDEKPGAPSKLAKILTGSFTTADHAKFNTAQITLLNDAGITSVVGSIAEAGPLNDGTSHVLFMSGTAYWGSLWPQWAYEAAREAMLHGKQLRVTYTGDDPFGYLLTGVFILNEPA